MTYAVIKSGGKQYRVKEGDILEVDKLPVKKNESVVFDQVLLWVGEDSVKVGTPILKDIKIQGKVVDQIKGEKLYVRKFKSKVRYRRTMGFRALLTRVEIQKIG